MAEQDAPRTVIQPRPQQLPEDELETGRKRSRLGVPENDSRTEMDAQSEVGERHFARPIRRWKTRPTIEGNARLAPPRAAWPTSRPRSGQTIAWAPMPDRYRRIGTSRQASPGPENTSDCRSPPHARLQQGRDQVSQPVSIRIGIGVDQDDRLETRIEPPQHLSHGAALQRTVRHSFAQNIDLHLHRQSAGPTSD